MGSPAVWILHVLWTFCVLGNIICVFGGIHNFSSCTTNEECNELQVCIDLKCQDPCPGICHSNATCRVRNHVPFCACKPGFIGNPFTGCHEQALTQCSNNDDCGELHSCINLYCQNPCPGICHGNTTCRVHKHAAYCACKPGFIGDPFTGCHEQGRCYDSYSDAVADRVATHRTCKKDYLVVNKGVKWNEAVTECEKLGRNLVTIDSSEEWEDVKRAMIIAGPPEHYWIGGTNLNNNTWMWLSSWTRIHFSNWEKGEPNNLYQHCIYIMKSNTKWDDWDCYSGDSHYICEKCVV